MADTQCVFCCQVVVAHALQCPACRAGLREAGAASWIIGGEPACEIVVDASTVSSRHVRLRFTQNQFIVEDLGSTNGTFVNGRRIATPTLVSRSDTVTLGRDVPMPWPAPGRVLCIGQAADNDIVLDRPMVSAHHARLLLRPGQALLEDLGSTNGTFVNGRRISSPTPVAQGDHVGLGRLAARLLPGPNGLSLQALDVASTAAAPAAQRGFEPVAPAAMSAGAPGPATMIGELRREVSHLKEQTHRQDQKLAAVQRMPGTLRAVFATGALLVVGALGWTLLPRPTVSPPPPPATTKNEPGLTNQEVFQKNSPAVVLIRHRFLGTDGSGTAEGTGFCVDPAGLIVTNRHVIAPWSEHGGSGHSLDIRVYFSGSRVGLEGHLVREHPDPDIDLALVQVKGSGHPAVLGFDSDPNSVQVGEPVIVVGYPLGTHTVQEEGATPSLTAGSLSKKTSHILQYDAAMHHGSSGSPVFNQRGRVIAVNFAGATSSTGDIAAGIDYGIPARYAVELIHLR